MHLFPPGWIIITHFILVWLNPPYPTYNWYKTLLPGFLLELERGKICHVNFKVLLYVFKGLNGQAPNYIPDLLLYRFNLIL